MTTITHAELETYRGKFISVTRGMAGHFAVMYWWNPDLHGFWEPWESGQWRYENEDQARVDAIQWSTRDGVPYLLPVAPAGRTS